MYKHILASVLLFTGIGAALAADTAPVIRLNSIGYLPEAPKRASVAAPIGEFSVVHAPDGAVVWTGAATGPVHNEDTGEDLWIADFSALRQPGAYRVEGAGVGASAPFRIAANVYDQPFIAATRAMYLWRCGTAVRGEYGGDVFAHAACHMEDGWMDFATGEHVQRDGTGGWHDAGDYNKYVTNAGITVAAMFMAWEDFGPRIGRLQLNLPEAGGPLPEFLAELRWEMDWLFKMQAPDGRVYHKLSTEHFGGFIMPENETTPRYFTPWGTVATAQFVAMMAQAARNFVPHDAAYAARCLEAARVSYAFLQANPEDHRADLNGFRTGGYQSPDPDDRFWAAVEMWKATGDADALRDAEKRLRALEKRWEANFDWGDVTNFGLLAYLSADRPGRDEALLAEVREGLIATADEIVATGGAHGYARTLGSRYYWGCNGGVVRQTLLLQAAHRRDPKPAYREAALDTLNHVFGRNVHGRSYVTGLGHLPPLFPHARRSGADDVVAPWPGYIVGGPHPRASDWFDVQADPRTNEIAINWQGALIYALAGFLGDTEAAR